MSRDLLPLLSRVSKNITTMSPVTDDMARILPEEHDAIKRVGVIVGEWNWDARRLT